MNIKRSELQQVTPDREGANSPLSPIKGKVYDYSQSANGQRHRPKTSKGENRKESESQWEEEEGGQTAQGAP